MTCSLPRETEEKKKYKFWVGIAQYRTCTVYADYREAAIIKAYRKLDNIALKTGNESPVAWTLSLHKGTLCLTKYICKKHPRYGGILKPTKGKCPSCWELYLDEQVEKWHIKSDTESLQDFLKLSDVQYQDFLTNPKKLYEELAK